MKLGKQDREIERKKKDERNEWMKANSMCEHLHICFVSFKWHSEKYKFL